MSGLTYFTDGHAVSMTLRDYFAAKVMQAFQSRTDLDDIKPSELSGRCYAIADAMLKARKQ